MNPWKMAARKYFNEYNAMWCYARRLETEVGWLNDAIEKYPEWTKRIGIPGVSCYACGATSENGHSTDCIRQIAKYGENWDL